MVECPLRVGLVVANVHVRYTRGATVVGVSEYKRSQAAKLPFAQR